MADVRTEKTVTYYCNSNKHRDKGPRGRRGGVAGRSAGSRIRRGTGGGRGREEGTLAVLSDNLTEITIRLNIRNVARLFLAR